MIPLVPLLSPSLLAGCAMLLTDRLQSIGFDPVDPRADEYCACWCWGHRETRSRIRLRQPGSVHPRGGRVGDIGIFLACRAEPSSRYIPGGFTIGCGLPWRPSVTLWCRMKRHARLDGRTGRIRPIRTASHGVRRPRAGRPSLRRAAGGRHGGHDDRAHSRVSRVSFVSRC